MYTYGLPVRWRSDCTSVPLEIATRGFVVAVYSMSTFEGIPLQPLGSKRTEDDNHPELLGQDDTADNAQQTSSSTPGPVSPVTTSWWKTFFTTVAILFANGFLNAGITMIGPFYPIMVSCVVSIIFMKLTAPHVERK